MVYTTKSAVQENKTKIHENRKDIASNKSAIDDLKAETRFMFESSQARLERIIHRMIAVVIVLIVLLFVSNAVWIYAWNTWDNDATTVINKDGNFIGGNGEIKN